VNKKDHYIFPSIFFEDGGFIGVRFPDLPGCNTFGKNETEALRMARDALGGHLLCMGDTKEPIPVPTPFSQIKAGNGEAIVFVEVWLSVLRDEEKNKAVNKTITLPNWLNKKAIEAQINFSSTLQDALRQKLGLQ
jgi:predicted RNase H-like HicB family nuclease